MLVTVPLANRLPFSILLFCFVALASVGGGLYALAQSVWVAFLGRGRYPVWSGHTTHLPGGDGHCHGQNQRETGKETKEIYSLHHPIFCTECRICGTLW